MARQIDCSVVMATLNSERYVAGAVRSVLTQPGVVVELIVVDGGSHDATIDIVRSLSETCNSHVEIVRQAGRGIYSAMNQGLARVRGRVVSILNSDDALLPGALRKVVSEFDSDEWDIVVGQGFGLMCVDNRLVYFPLTGNWPTGISGMSVIHPATFVRRSVIEQNGMFDESFKLSADYDYFVRLARRLLRVKVIEDPLAVFRIGGASTQAAFEVLLENRRVRRRWYGRNLADTYFIGDAFRHAKSLVRERVLSILLGRQRLARHRADRILERNAEINESMNGLMQGS